MCDFVHFSGIATLCYATSTSTYDGFSELNAVVVADRHIVNMQPVIMIFVALSQQESQRSHIAIIFTDNAIVTWLAELTSKQQLLLAAIWWLLW